MIILNYQLQVNQHYISDVTNSFSLITFYIRLSIFGVLESAHRDASIHIRFIVNDCFLMKILCRVNYQPRYMSASLTDVSGCSQIW